MVDPAPQQRRRGAQGPSQDPRDGTGGRGRATSDPGRDRVRARGRQQQLIPGALQGPVGAQAAVPRLPPQRRPAALGPGHAQQLLERHLQDHLAVERDHHAHQRPQRHLRHLVHAERRLDRRPLRPPLAAHRRRPRHGRLHADRARDRARDARRGRHRRRHHDEDSADGDRHRRHAISLYLFL